MSIPGRKRRITDEQVKRIREWKPLAGLAREFGVSVNMVSAIRNGRYQHKQPSP